MDLNTAGSIASLIGIGLAIAGLIFAGNKILKRRQTQKGKDVETQIQVGRDLRINGKD